MRYGYIRVSTYGQAKNGNSLQDQRDKLMVNGILQENIFVDKYTGTKIDRPGFDRLLGLLQPGDELVVCKLDRFARTAADGSKLVRKLVDDGIIVNILNMGRADNTPTGKLMVTILLAFAEYERDMIVERTSEGREYARENKPGFREGRPPKEYPDFENFLKMKKDGLMTVKEGCERLGISRSQWYALERKKGAEHSPSDQRPAMPC